MTTAGAGVPGVASGVGKGVPRRRAGSGGSGGASLFSIPGSAVQPRSGSPGPRQTSSFKASTVVCCWCRFGGFLGLCPDLTRPAFPAGAPIVGEPAGLPGASEVVDDDVAPLVFEIHGVSFRVDLPVVLRSQAGAGWVRHGWAGRSEARNGDK